MAITESNNDLEKEKELAIKEAKEIVLDILKKHLTGKYFDESYAKTWGDNIIQEIEEELKETCQAYGFVIFFYMSDTTAFVSDHRCVNYKKTDMCFLVPFHTDDFYSEVRIMLTKIHKKMDNFLDYINPEVSLKIHQKMVTHLDRRKFIYDKMGGILDDIADNINDILLDNDNFPCSYNICYINKIPTKGLYFTYKVSRLDYSPIFSTFATPTLACRSYLFMLNN